MGIQIQMMDLFVCTQTNTLIVLEDKRIRINL